MKPEDQKAFKEAMQQMPGEAESIHEALAAEYAWQAALDYERGLQEPATKKQPLVRLTDKEIDILENISLQIYAGLEWKDGLRGFAKLLMDAMEEKNK